MTISARFNCWLERRYTRTDVREVVASARAWARTWDLERAQPQVEAGFRLLEAIEALERRYRQEGNCE